MRRPTFERWIQRQLLNLTNTESFNLRKLAALAQKDNPRLREPLLLYAHETGKLERLFSYIWKNDLLESYNSVAKLIANKDLTEVSLREQEIEGLPREYKKFLSSYRIAHQKPENTNESKKLRWERSRALQLEKGISTAEIYRSLELNPGNVNAYMKHGALDKLSLKNATNIMKYLYKA